MNIEVVLKEEGVMARGRNGYFTPKYAYIHDAIEGNVTIHVGSRNPGKTEPLMLRLTRKGLKDLVEALVYFLDKEDQAAFPPVDVVATIQEGMLASVSSSRPGVRFYSIDRDAKEGDTSYRHLKTLTAKEGEYEEFDAEGIRFDQVKVDPKGLAFLLPQIDSLDTLWDSCPHCARSVLLGEKVEVSKNLAMCPPCANNHG